MTEKEFYNELAPSILDLQSECPKLTEAEFCSYREHMMDEFKQPGIVHDFMEAVFSMVYKNVFQTA